MNSLMQLSIVAQSCLGGSDNFSDDSEYQDGRKNMAEVSGVKRKEEDDVSHWFGVPSLPYPDHSYAKPPPVIPPLKSHQYNYQHKELTPSINPSSNQLTISPIAPKEVQSIQEVGSNPGVETWEGSITRCICEFQHDDGYMICCDRCSVWQHVDCMGVDRQNIPDTYLCELCRPRIVDKHHAIRCQARKRELLMQRADSSDTDTEEDVKSRRMVMRRRKSKQSSHQSGGGHRRKSQEGKHRGQQFRFKNKNKKRHSSKPRHDSYLSSPNSGLPISPTLTPVSMVMGQDFASFRLLQPCRNSYTPDLRRNLQEPSGLDRGVDMTMYSTTTDSFHEFSLVSVSMLQISADIKTQGLEANKDIKFEEPIIEYTGKVILKDQYTFSGSMGHVLQYKIKGFPGIDVCIDSSHHDNQAKFIRRSANPNARLRHFFDANNNLRFCIWSTTHVLKGSEVTLPLEFENRSGGMMQSNFEHVSSEISSPTIQRRRRQSSRISESSAISDLPGDLGATSHCKDEGEYRDVQRRGSDLGASFPGRSSPVKSSPSQKVKVAKDRRRSETDRLLHPYGSSRQRKNSSALESNENNNTTEKPKQQVKKDENASEDVRRSTMEGQDGKKLTREEKKLEAIMKAFERIDKKNERKNQRAEKRMNERMKNHASVKKNAGRNSHKISQQSSQYDAKRSEQSLASKVDVKQHLTGTSRDHHHGDEDDDEDDHGDDNYGGDRSGFFDKMKNGDSPYSNDDEGDDDDDDDHYHDNDDQPVMKPARERSMKGINIKEHASSDVLGSKANNSTSCKNASPKIQERRSLRLNSETMKPKNDARDGLVGPVNDDAKRFKNKIKRNTKRNTRSGIKKKHYDAGSSSEDYEASGREESSKSEASQGEDSDDNDTNKLNLFNDAIKKLVEEKSINSPMRSMSDPAPMQQCVQQAGSLSVDSNQGFTKKRWLRQAIYESSENQLMGLDSGIATPLKKRRLTVDDDLNPHPSLSFTTTPSFLPSITPDHHHQHHVLSATSSLSLSHKLENETCQDVQNQDHHHHVTTSSATPCLPPTSPFNNAPDAPAPSDALQQPNDASEVADIVTSSSFLVTPRPSLLPPFKINESSTEACLMPDDLDLFISSSSQSIALSPPLIVSSSLQFITLSPSLIVPSSSSLPPSSSLVHLHPSSSDMQTISPLILPQSAIIVSSSSASLTSSSSSSLLSPISPCCLSPTSYDGTNKDPSFKNMASVGKKKVSLSEYRNRMKTTPSSMCMSSILTSIATPPTCSVVTHSTPPIFSHGIEISHLSSDGFVTDEVDKQDSAMFADNVANFSAACVSNDKKKLKKEWDFEETAAEKILTKSLSLTDRLKFEFGLDAQEEVDTSSALPTSSPALLQSSSSTSSLPTPPSSSYSTHPNEFSTSTQNHSGVQSSPPMTCSPQKMKHFERNSESSASFRSERERTRSHNHHHRRHHHHHFPPDHHGSSRFHNSSRPASHSTSLEGEGGPAKSRVGRGKYGSNDSSNSPSRHHHRRRYSSPIERQGCHNRERELVDPRQRNHSRNDQKYLKYHQQNSITFSRSRFQHQ